MLIQLKSREEIQAIAEYDDAAGCWRFSDTSCVYNAQAPFFGRVCYVEDDAGPYYSVPGLGMVSKQAGTVLDCFFDDDNPVLLSVLTQLQLQYKARA